MPRRKSGTQATGVATPSHKRQLSRTPTTATPGSRSSKRLKESAERTPTNKSSPKSSPKKSKYFEGGSDEEELPTTSTSSEVEESGYEDDGVASSAESLSSEPESEDDYDSQEDRRRKTGPKRGGRGGTTTSTASKGPGETDVAAAMGRGKELWRPGVKAGLGPGKQVFIEKPKPRGDGGIAYAPDKIHPNTMAFLADLKNNNDREWLKMHDPDYRQSWKDWESYVETLTEKISEVDDTIPELPPKDLVFRIYRDIRFSSDPTPYKAHFSAAWSRTGRKGPYAHYYVHLEPGGRSFVGSGRWMPEAEQLALLRADIDRKPKKIRRVLTDARVRKHIFGGIPHDEKKAIKAFAESNAENALKTKPKGYDADNPNIELLRLRNFTIGKRIPDEVVVGPQGLQTIVELIGVMAPFVAYLNSVVMPDGDDASSGGSGSDEDDEHDEHDEHDHDDHDDHDDSIDQ